MTEEEINSMPAGRAMDMLVAEKIFGWRHYSDDLWERMKDWLIQRREFNWTEQTPEESMLRMMITPEGHSRWPFEYSTSIDCAWLVREELSERGIVLAINNRRLMQRACYGHRRQSTDLTPEWSGFAETDPLAICRMALKVVHCLV